MSEVIALAGFPPEVLAYGFAMYSRSSLSIRGSLKKILEKKNEAKFFEQNYFAFGHKSIADNAHIPLAFENISQIAAFELEDQSLWDGQERSTRYQNFDGNDNFIIPQSVVGSPFESQYLAIAERLMKNYRSLSKSVFEALHNQYAKPAEMSDSLYEKTLKARAFDVSRYFLFGGINTSVGQITSARTLEEQISRLLSSEYDELRDLGQSIKKACKEKPHCPEGKDEPPVAPTLVKYAEANDYAISLRKRLEVVADHLLGGFHDQANRRRVSLASTDIDLEDEIIATLLYQHSYQSYEVILNVISNNMPEHFREEILGYAAEQRGKHDALPRAFMAGHKFQFDICMDRGGERDLHRQRNCVQIHQPLTLKMGWETPELLRTLNLAEDYDSTMSSIWTHISILKAGIGADADYLIPFAFRAGTLYKMHAWQDDYMIELRSAPQGHFSYRSVACDMYDLTVERYPFLKQFIRVTPFEQEDIFRR